MSLLRFIGETWECIENNVLTICRKRRAFYSLGLILSKGIG